MTAPPVLPGPFLTVVIRDDAPMIHCNDSPSYRSVQIMLTEEQRDKLKLYQTSSSGGVPFFETISKCFIEGVPAGLPPR